MEKIEKDSVGPDRDIITAGNQGSQLSSCPHNSLMSYEEAPSPLVIQYTKLNTITLDTLPMNPHPFFLRLS